jgi:hypothetical protein
MVILCFFATVELIDSRRGASPGFSTHHQMLLEGLRIMVDGKEIAQHKTKAASHSVNIIQIQLNQQSHLSYV